MRRHLGSLALLLTFVVAAVLGAQQPTRDPARPAPPPAGKGLIAGQVVAADTGQPLPGVRVSLGGGGAAPGQSATTDAQGRFEFADMTRDHVYLRVEGPHVESSESFAIPASGEVELRASVQCRFRVDARPDDPADRFRVLDGEGQELRITAQTAHATYLQQSVRRRDDGFPVCIVGEEAAFLVLYQGEVELQRVALDLQPDELQIVTP